MTPDELMHAINNECAHLWMVRTFLKHCEEAEEDEELREIPRGVYDYCLALGPGWHEQNAETFLRAAKRKFTKLKKTSELFQEIQPDVSTHTNFQMAALSLQLAVEKIEALLEIHKQRKQEAKG
ncbi:Amidohydrolase [Planctomycetales bacterium 10988]|nr:Amidohydrolase [Planctomycetales bacterium 10988]